MNLILKIIGLLGVLGCVLGIAYGVTKIIIPASPDSKHAAPASRVAFSALPLAGDRENKTVVQNVDTNMTTGVSAIEPADFTTLWFTDFDSDMLAGINRAGKIVWQQHMGSSPIPPASYATNTEYVTVAPNGNLIIADGDGMMVQEIDRATHHLLWQYGVKDKQGYAWHLTHQPDKSFKINDHEVVINDGNNRRVIIVDQPTNEIVWQYGHTLEMGTASGYLKGNTSVYPNLDGSAFYITDTLQKKIFLIDRATKSIVQQWAFPDSKWIEHMRPTASGGLVMEDRQKHEVFEVDKDGHVIWSLSVLADGTSLKYPTDVVKLQNGHVLISEAGRDRIIEVDPATKNIVWSYAHAGFVTTLAVDQNSI